MKIKKICSLLSIIFVSQITSKTLAQIKPDNTLGSENSTVNSIDDLRDRIEGGAIRGENLFHSFEEFSIREGLEVYFANPEEINNIFSRITGNNISEIFGTLGVEGVANLFLINPNGIIFGENATVDVGGSFIATTAEKVYFENDKVFNVRDRDRPILTWNAPIGLGLEETSGKIVVRGDGHNLAFTPERLLVPINDFPLTGTQVSTGKNLALIGNQIKLDGGIINLLSEKIEIGSVRQGKVIFSSLETDFDYSEVEQFGDLVLDNYSFIIIDGTRATKANFESNSLNLENGSLILFSGEAEFSGNRPQTTNINVREQLLIRGATTSTPPTPDGLSRGVSSLSSRDINISTKNLIIESGGQIGTLALPGFPNGTININATGLIKVSGFIPSNNVLGFSNISTSSVGTENSNNINIKTKDLFVNNGGVIGSSSINGRSGDVQIQAKTISIEGFSLNNRGVPFPTQIGSSAFGNGVGGTVNFQVDNLSVFNGGAITTSSFSDAEAGSINVNANSITIDNSSSITSLVSQIDPRLIGETPILPDVPLPTGNAGSISLNTNNLTISDRASVTVQNDGAGNAGSIEIDANSINLNKEGNISAAALLGEGGNINIQSDRITLNNSLISAEAGGGSGGNIEIASDRFTVNNSDITAASLSQRGGNLSLTGDRFIFQDSNLNASAEEKGNGGNVTINADTVLGINSDITATAERGDGGNVTIDADGVLGFREANAIENNDVGEVDVTSQFGTDGTITITNPQNTNSDPIVLLVTAPQGNNDLPLRTDCENDAGNGEAYLTDSTHPNIPDSPETYLDDEDVIRNEPVVEEPLPPSSSIIEELLWKLGKPYALADVQIQTPDGRIFGVNREQLMKMQQRGCVDIEAIKN